MWAEVRPLIDVWAEVRPLIDVDLKFICLRKQQSKFFTRMLSTPSSEPVNDKLDPAATCKLMKNPKQLVMFPIKMDLAQPSFGKKLK